MAALPAGLHAAPRGGFTHSVASGDPQQDSVTLWTRYIGSNREASLLQVEVASDEQFQQVVSLSTAQASPETDFCAHARPTDLAPGQWFFYRFIAPDGAISPTGRTRTLPTGPLRSFRIGIFSCANATSGWFNAYGHAAARNDLDLLVHLGDYIYESKLTRSDAIEGMAAARGIEPMHETVSLLDYRQRYASYRSDPALQELHRLFPMVVMWDDHETANNSWEHGAANHDPAEEGPWDARMAAGVRAFQEWLPMREAPYTSYELGDLATLFRLETRLLGRSEQLDLDAWLAGKDDIEAAAIAFRDGPLADPARSMLGAKQEKWLADGLAASTAVGKPWQILAQQVIMSPMLSPTNFDSWIAPFTTPTAEDLAGLEQSTRLSALGIPRSMDKWDGYPAARKRLLDASRSAGADLVVLSGDSHNAWAFDMEHEGQPAGVEFAVHSVSSLGLEKGFDGDPEAIARSLRDANSNLKWCDTSQRGYMVLDITPEAVTNQWLFVASGIKRSIEVSGSQRLRARKGSPGLALPD